MLQHCGSTAAAPGVDGIMHGHLTFFECMSDPPDKAAAQAEKKREHWRRAAARHFAVVLLLAALVAIGYVGHQALKHMGPPERCWEYQERDGKLYKVNPCTGQFLLVGDVVAPQSGN